MTIGARHASPALGACKRGQVISAPRASATRPAKLYLPWRSQRVNFAGVRQGVAETYRAWRRVPWAKHFRRRGPPSGQSFTVPLDRGKKREESPPVHPRYKYTRSHPIAAKARASLKPVRGLSLRAGTTNSRRGRGTHIFPERIGS